jgi:hypothetical protein
MAKLLRGIFDAGDKYSLELLQKLVITKLCSYVGSSIILV